MYIVLRKKSYLNDFKIIYRLIMLTLIALSEYVTKMYLYLLKITKKVLSKININERKNAQTIS